MTATKISIQKKLAFSLVATLLMLVALEGLARVAYAVLRQDSNASEQEERTDWKTASAELGWVLTPGFKGLCYGVPREFDADGLLVQDAEQLADRTTPRIVFLGDSNTFGIKMPSDKTFVELVDRRLPGASVINLAVIGYSSFQGAKVFQRYLQRDVPDIAVVSFNFNDRRSVVADDIDSDDKFHRIYERSQTHDRFAGLTDYFFLCRVIQSILDKLGWTSAFDDTESESQEGVHYSEIFPRVSPEQYRRNLEEIAELAAGAGVSLLYMTLNDNPLKTENLKRGVKLFEAGQDEDAIRQLKRALDQDGINKVIARVYLAKVYERQGMLAEAEAYSMLYGQFASQAGRAPRIVDWQYNHIMREVAREYEINVVEAGRMLNQTPADYLDFCHPDVSGHERIAALLTPRLSELLAARRATPNYPASQAPAGKVQE